MPIPTNVIFLVVLKYSGRFLTFRTFFMPNRFPGDLSYDYMVGRIRLKRIKLAKYLKIRQ
jgi:hypothetical protein